jgi:hypothetical protein
VRHALQDNASRRRRVFVCSPSSDTTGFSSVELQFSPTRQGTKRTPPALAAWRFGFNLTRQGAKGTPPALAGWRFSLDLKLARARRTPPALAEWRFSFNLKLARARNGHHRLWPRGGSVLT